MKSIYQFILVCILTAVVTGCAQFPTATRSVAFTPSIQKGDVIEAAINVAREMKFPPATKIEKADGLVEFGGFEMPEIGITAQVRIKSDGQLEVTIKRGSVYIPLGVDKTADEFRSKLDERLQKMGK